MEKVVRGTEWQKMVAGEPYDAADPELKAARERCRKLYHTFNTCWQEKPARDALLHELLGGRGQECAINPPFFCDYGANIFVGENFYANVGCTILDVCEVHMATTCCWRPGCRSTPPLTRWRWRRASGVSSSASRCGSVTTSGLAEHSHLSRCHYR